MRLKLVENIEVLEEAINPSEALKLKENSDAYAILYGWQYKNEPAVELYPEEHSEESLKQRIDQIIKDYHKYSENNSRGNRYAYERDFIFYVLYNDKNRLKEDFLQEAKKSKNKNRKKKKIDYTEFNTPAKLKAWVKKRQKGLSPFTYLNPNAGNVEYNQSIFNQMMGSADGASNVGVSYGGISNGGLSAPAGDGGGMAMGESMNLKEAWYRVTCNGGNNFGKASLSFQKPGPDGKFKIGIKSKANFTNGEQVTFKTKEDAQEFAERVLNSDVGKKRGMTKIYEPQVISDSNSERFVEVDTVFGKAYMRPELATSFGYTVENDNNLILDEITNILENIGYKKIDTYKISDNIIYLFRNDQFISPMGTKIDIELLLPEDIGNVFIRFKHDSAKFYYNRKDLGSNISLKTLDEIKSNLETYIKRKILQSADDYKSSLPKTEWDLKRNYDDILDRYPFAKKDLEYVLLFD